MKHDSVLARRTVLQAAAAAAVAGAIPLQALAADAAAALPEAVTKLTGGKEPTPGKVTLWLPELAENGNSVPVGVKVEGEMAGDVYVKAMHIVATDNPEPTVASFELTPSSGRPEVMTRMRLAKSQKVWALAETSDGQLWSGNAEVRVTVGGCGG